MTIKPQIKQITKTIEARNWRSTKPEIKPIYKETLRLTNFLPATALINERFFCILNDIKERQKCLTCKKNYVKYTNGLNGYRKYCSAKCCANNENTKTQMKQTFHKKYGGINTKKIQQKSKQTCLKKYGTEYVTQSDEFKQKRKQTCLKKYGVEEYSSSLEYKKQIKNIQTKTKKTCQKKFGTDNPMQFTKVKEKWKITRMSNFYKSIKNEQYLNFQILDKFEDYKGCLEKYKWQCMKCLNIFLSNLKDGSRPICHICNPQIKAKTQQKIYEYITKILPPQEIIVLNTRSILENFELDIYLPQDKIAFEYNGLYWHSEISGQKDRQYHLNKTQLCEEKNIQLIHIFEDEWIFKQQIVKSRIKHILGKTKYKLYGRKCTIKQIDTQTKNKFLNKYHIQGEDKSQVKLGAFYRNRLIAVMTFGKRKITGSLKQDWELIRYCTISNFNCIGVAGKLLKHFERNYEPKKIISYADKRWSNGNLYYQLGFNLKHISPPNYWYLKQKDYTTRLNRVSFQKHKLKTILDNFNDENSEWINMQNNNYDRIWDCGNYVFEWISSRSEY